MSRYGFYKYDSVAEKREKAKKATERLKKKDPDIEPIVIEGRTIAKSWWGKAWNENLESYADYSNRIGRGRSYVKNGNVIDLKITEGNINALVQGSGRKPYSVIIQIDTLTDDKIKKITNLCNNKISSLEDLLEGKFPKDLEVLFMQEEYGLFPTPAQIHFSCSCPDIAYMCKHVAAVLYGVGAKLDNNPMLFFTLRNIDTNQLIKKSIESKLDNMLKNAGKRSKRAIDEADINDIFGI